jgi:hypothetical protein
MKKMTRIGKGHEEEEERDNNDEDDKDDDGKCEEIRKG